MGRNAGDMSGADIGFNFLRGAQAVGQGIRQSQALESERMALDDEKGVRAAYEQIAGAVGPTGDVSVLDGNPLLNTRHGTIAAGKFFADRANTEASRLQMLQNMGKADDTFYRNTFRPLAMAAQEAYQAGDTQRFGGIMSQLSAASPFPYRYRANSDGTLSEFFRSSKDGGWVDTGEKLTPDQALQALRDIMSGEQNVLGGADMRTRTVNPRFLAMAARYKMGTILDNADALADQNRWIPLTKGGKTIWVVPQNRHDDYTAGPAYRIVDDSGQMGGMVESLDALLKKGWIRADVAADLVYKRRRAVESGKGGGLGSSPGDQMMTDALLRAGYVYDKNYKRWFKTKEDLDGKPQPDYARPLSQAEYQEIAGRMSGSDPLGYLGTGTAGKASPSAVAPASGVRRSPDRAKGVLGIWRPSAESESSQASQATRASENAGQVVRLSSWPEERWAVIGEDGRALPVSREEAVSLYEQQARQEKEQAAAREPWFWIEYPDKSGTS